jgi:predicted transposase YdaD
MLGIKFEETRVFQEAQEDKAKEIALNLIKQGLTLEAIAQATGLTITQIQTNPVTLMRNINVEEPRAIREAREEVTVEIALRCLKDNLPLETIAQFTGLTIAQLQALQSQL